MIVSRHIATQSPYNGLPGGVLNIPGQWVGYVAASGSSGMYSTADWMSSAANSINKSVAPGTQPDVGRNVMVLLSPNTGSAGLYSAGSIVIYGKDSLGSTRSEGFAVTAINSGTDPVKGSINFASIDSISAKNVIYHTASSSAASAVSLYVGYGQKIGLPLNIVSSDAVHAVHFGTTPLRTSAGASSSNNQYVIVTGDYHVNGLSNTAAYNAASLVQVDYRHLGFRAPAGSY